MIARDRRLASANTPFLLQSMYQRALGHVPTQSDIRVASYEVTRHSSGPVGGLKNGIVDGRAPREARRPGARRSSPPMNLTHYQDLCAVQESVLNILNLSKENPIVNSLKKLKHPTHPSASPHPTQTVAAMPASSKAPVVDAGSTAQPIMFHGVVVEGDNPKKPGKQGLTAVLGIDSLQLIDGFNPRTDVGDLSALAENIKSFGVISAILVRPANKLGQFQIIAGERRYRACILAGVKQIPCIIRQDLVGDDERALAVAMAENSEDGRTNLNMIEFGRGCQKLEKKGWPVRRIARDTCCKPEYVRRALKLVSAPEGLRTKVESSECSPSVALEVLKMSDKERAKILSTLGSTTTVKDVTAFRKKAQIEASTNALAKHAGPTKVIPIRRSIGAWRKASEKQAQIQQLCAILEEATAEQLGTPEYLGVRGAVAIALWDRGDRTEPFAPDMEPEKGSKDYAARMNELTGFNAAVKAEAAKFRAAHASSEEE